MLQDKGAMGVGHSLGKNRKWLRRSIVFVVLLGAAFLWIAKPWVSHNKLVLTGALASAELSIPRDIRLRRVHGGEGKTSSSWLKALPETWLKIGADYQCFGEGLSEDNGFMGVDFRRPSRVLSVEVSASTKGITRRLLRGRLKSRKREVAMKFEQPEAFDWPHKYVLQLSNLHGSIQFADCYYRGKGGKCSLFSYSRNGLLIEPHLNKSSHLTWETQTRFLSCVIDGFVTSNGVTQPAEKSLDKMGK